MPISTFSGLEVGKRMLNALKLVQETTGHNISNASNPAYSRQRIHVEAARPFTFSLSQGIPGMIGQGMDATSVERARDAYLDVRRMAVAGNKGQYGSLETSLSELEQVFGEPGDNGIRNGLDSLSAALSSVASQPEDPSLRAAALRQAESLASQFRSASQRVSEIQRDTDTQIKDKIGLINGQAAQVASLNYQIARQLGAGNNPSDLLDQRQEVLDQLASSTGAKVEYASNGMANVNMGGHWLVAMDVADKIQSAPDALRPGLSAFTFASDGRSTTPTSGELGGMLTLRDQEAPQALARLDALANTLRADLNTLQASGYGYNSATAGGPAFFTGTSAADLAVDPALLAAPMSLAAAVNPNSPGDGGNALAMNKAFSTARGALGGSTYVGALADLISERGTATAQAKSQASFEGSLAKQLDQLQQSVSGVNIDEETTNLMEAQHAYEAGARYMATLDSMLDVLINDIKR
jgi:flagellar hook-associated protein 1 FlgK